MAIAAMKGVPPVVSDSAVNEVELVGSLDGTERAPQDDCVTNSRASTAGGSFNPPVASGLQLPEEKLVASKLAGTRLHLLQREATISE